MRNAWVALLLLMSCRCDDELASSDEARLVHIRGVVPSVAIGSPHAPMVLPYVKHHSDTWFEHGDRRVQLLDVEPDELDGAALLVDDDAERFAVERDDGWMLFFAPEEAFAAAPDPERLSAPPDWSNAPTWSERVTTIFATTGEPAALRQMIEDTGVDRAAVLRATLDCQPGERADGAQEWAHRNGDRWMMLAGVHETPDASALDALAEAYGATDAPEVVLRRARWTLPPERLAIAPSILETRALEVALDEVERAAALLLLPPSDRARVACALLSEPPLAEAPLTSSTLAAAVASSVDGECASLEAWVAAHICETSADCEHDHPSRTFEVSPDLRDGLARRSRSSIVADAITKYCAAGKSIDAPSLRRQDRLGYRIDGRLPRMEVLETACRSEDTTFEHEGALFELDDAARSIRRLDQGGGR